jgi:PAS domain S-box-containing protein
VAADIQDCLKGLGYSVSRVANSAAAAVQQASEDKPDLVLMDIQLNGPADGIDAANRIREQFDVPVVFLTAHADEATLQRAKVTAPFGYILKPYDERGLHTTIEVALYRHASEVKIKRLETWLAAVLQSIGDAVVATDKWGLITFMNARASAFGGCNSAEAVGKPLTEVFMLLDEITRQPVDSPISKIVQDEVILNSQAPVLMRAGNRSEIAVEYTAAPIRDAQRNISGVVWVFRDLAARRQAEEERVRLVQDLQGALANVKTLSGLLPMCAGCKKIRDDQGYWQQVESYLEAHSQARFTHGLCPECREKLYPGLTD